MPVIHTVIIWQLKYSGDVGKTLYGQELAGIKSSKHMQNWEPLIPACLW